MSYLMKSENNQRSAEDLATVLAMGRGQSGVNAGSSQQLLYGAPSRAGTKEQRISRAERERVERQAEEAQAIAAHQVSGGRVRRDEEDTRYWEIKHRWHRWILHRTDGPALEYRDGTKKWYDHGQLHRTDGPALITASGTEVWYDHDQRHRTDGPARTTAAGDREWFVENQYHREDGPAIERFDGTQEWFIHGKRHRQGGPAIERPDGSQEFYEEGHYLFMTKSD
jgi:hypothetical protein